MTKYNKTPSHEKRVSDALRQSWVHRHLPERLWPYAQLARWERPIGWQLLMWPCLWSLSLAYLHGVGIHSVEVTPVPRFENIPFYMFVLMTMAVPAILLVLGAVAMRGAGCTYNDLVDRDIDAQVDRTRSRPIPSGRVSTRSVFIFLVAQLLVGVFVLAALAQGRTFIWGLGISSLGLVIIYPFMKRITWWPQLFLGLAFSWGALMGWASLENSLAAPPITLYVGCIFWVIGYDTIYAHQDKEDDALIGVKSTARLFAERTKLAVAILYGLAIGAFFTAFVLALLNLSWVHIPAFAGLSMGALRLMQQIYRLDIHQPSQCLALFRSNNKVGLWVFAGLLVSILASMELFVNK